MLFLQGYFITEIGKETKTACKHESLTLLPKSHVFKKKKKLVIGGMFHTLVRQRQKVPGVSQPSLICEPWAIQAFL